MISIMERTNIYISDTDDKIMLKVLSSISSIIFNEKIRGYPIEKLPGNGRAM